MTSSRQLPERVGDAAAFAFHPDTVAKTASFGHKHYTDDFIRFRCLPARFFSLCAMVSVFHALVFVFDAEMAEGTAAYSAASLLSTVVVGAFAAIHRCRFSSAAIADPVTGARFASQHVALITALTVVLFSIDGVLEPLRLAAKCAALSPNDGHCRYRLRVDSVVFFLLVIEPSSGFALVGGALITAAAVGGTSFSGLYRPPALPPPPTLLLPFPFTPLPPPTTPPL